MVNIINYFRISKKVVLEEGISAFISKVYYLLNRKKMYQHWIAENEAKSCQYKDLQYNPLISVVVPVYNVPGDILTECIESVLTQCYRNFELCLVDDASTLPDVKRTLKNYEKYKNIKVVYREKNGHISQTTNDGIRIASGEFVGLLDCDDVLAGNALYEIVSYLNLHPECDYVYSDEDKMTEQGYRKDPFFKPDWSPDTFMELNYTNHFSVYRKKLLDEVGGMREGLEGAQDYDLVLRIMEKTDRIGHISKVLYHWRESKNSTASNINAKSYILNSTKSAKEDAFKRRGLTGTLELVNDIMQYNVIYDVIGNPKASIIILSKDNYEMFFQCVDSIKKFTQYSNYEVILVDNGSEEINREKYNRYCEKNNIIYVYEKQEFNFSKMCNLGARNAHGDFFLFLNDDIEVCQEDWLDRLIGQAQLEHVGAVGAKLLYPGTNKIQHVGILNLETGPCHALYRMKDNISLYFGRNTLTYNYCAVTGACLMVSRDKFYQIGGFDETLSVAYNDVELCFSLLERNYYNVIRNDVALYHHESMSRGYDNENDEKRQRQKGEMEYLYVKHNGYKNYDPCYNCNLIQTRVDFSLKMIESQEGKE